LVQDTAYQSLLKSTRQQYHRQIAHVLEERFSETTESQPELLAPHYTEAGLMAQALPYWQSAGQRASQRSAYTEAVSHLTKGLELLKTLPDTPERIQQELTLQLTLGTALQATQGYATPEVGRVYARARELCGQVGETPQLFSALWGVKVFYIVRSELQTARELGEQLLRLAKTVQDPVLHMEVAFLVGATAVVLGEFSRAREYLEQGIGLYDPQQHRSHIALFGEDLGVSCRCWWSYALWNLGYPDQAWRKSQEALTLAQELSHPTSLGYALSNSVHIHREQQAAQAQAERLLELAAEQGFAFRLAIGTMHRGWALAMQGRGDEGIAHLCQGLVAYRAQAQSSYGPIILACRQRRMEK
jgi:predicted ATPase